MEANVTKRFTRSSYSIPPHLHAKVLSKKTGSMHDLSVSSFADLSMYGPGTSMDNVVRKKQPVMFGPRNQRGRRCGWKKSDGDPQDACVAELSSILVAHGLLAPPPTSTSLDSQKDSIDLGKFRDVPHGIGLQEQLRGDFTPRPVKTRGRPRKASSKMGRSRKLTKKQPGKKGVTTEAAASETGNESTSHDES